MAWESAYTSDYRDLLLRLKEVATGFPLVTMPVRTGSGDGILHGIHSTEASTPAETWTVTCTNDLPPATFSVTGSVSGAQADATVGTPYTNTHIGFTIAAGSIPFAAGDSFTFNTQVNPLVAATQVWEVKRWVGSGAKVVNYLASSVYDGTANYIPDRAADLSNNTAWISDNALGNGSWWQVQFDQPVDIRRLTISGFNFGGLTFNSNSAPKDFRVRYSDDGVSFTTDTTISNQTLWQTGELRSFDLSGTAGAHKYWRIEIDLVNSGTVACLPEVGLYTADNGFNVAYYGDGYDTILRGPGTAGGDNIYVEIRTDSFVHHGPNWILDGSIGYSASLDTLNQPSNTTDGFISGSIPFPEKLRLTLYDQPFKYWITVSGRLIKVAARFQNISELAYLGFPLQYSLPAQYPMPLIIAGSQSGGGNMGGFKYHWTRTDAAHSLLFNPGVKYQLLQGHDTMPSPARIYTPYNEWRQLCNLMDGSWSGASQQSLAVWPYQTGDGESVNTGVEADEDDNWPLTAINLIDRMHDANYGELDGLKHIPGIHAIESIIVHEGDNWVVLNNVFREQDNEFFAMRLV
jgi:hypothetical protein